MYHEILSVIIIGIKLFAFRERQIKEIEASFEACKSQPVHATNQDLYPLEVLPLLPDFERYVFFFSMLSSSVHVMQVTLALAHIKEQQLLVVC